MIYATYQLPQGGWQTTAIFDTIKEAEETMKHHAQGHRYIIAETEEELERKKRQKGYIACLFCEVVLAVEDLSLSLDETAKRAGWARISINGEDAGYLCLACMGRVKAKENRKI